MLVLTSRLLFSTKPRARWNLLLGDIFRPSCIYRHPFWRLAQKNWYVKAKMAINAANKPIIADFKIYPALI